MSRREIAASAALSVLLALLFTWPVALHPFSRLAAPTGPGDPYLNCWILGWDLGTITRDPGALLSGRIFDANIFFPATRTLAYSDHLILQAIVMTPAYLITRSLTFCYNALLLLSIAASAWTMYLFVRDVTGTRAGAAVAGLAWGVMPFRVAHLLHLQLQPLYFLPLAFLFLHRLMAGRRRRDAVLLGVFAALQAISSVYWGVIGALALGVAAVGLAVGIGRWRSGAIARRLVLAAVVGGVLVAPFAWPYWQVQQREGFARNLFEASQHEARLASYLRVPPSNVLYGTTGLLRPTGSRGAAHEGPEQELFPGVVLILLAAAGACVGWRRDSRPTVIAMGATAGVGVLLSLGPDGVRVVYALLHRFVFGFQAIRAPARFGVLVVFGGGVLAALALRAVDARLRRAGRRGAAVAVPVACLVLSGLEYLSVPLPTVPAATTSTAVGRWLAQEPGTGAVLYLPLGRDLENTTAMVASLEHRRPIVNGYSGQRPAFFMGLVDTLNQVPAAEALWSLRDLNVRFVVSPHPVAAPPGGPLVERATLSGESIYELRWTPDAEAAVPRPEPPAPPEPGPMPFSGAETLVYDVSWRSSPGVGMSAGTATFTATRGPVPGTDARGAAASRHFAVEIQTAPWVARFFEARDRLETWTDERLIPIRQEQHLREGRRVIDRATRFDVTARSMTVGEGPPLPWPREARDGISALFYVRTLPLVAGYSAVIPVVEGGRRYAIELSVDRVERIVVAGREVQALRAVPRLTSTGAGGRNVTSTVWISDDARRIPLRLDVETAFGSFRLDLVRESLR
jgi:hypothetical protein